MVQPVLFRRTLPVSQTAVAILFGGWGLWLRNSILSRPFLDGTGWDTTLAFHVWPWPFKFAAIINMPAFLLGLLLLWPLDAFRLGLSESVSLLPALLFVPLLWYLVGSSLDKRRSSAGRNKSTSKSEWVLLLLFMAACAAASSLPPSIWGYANHLELGALIWMTVATWTVTSAIIRKYKSKSPRSR